MVELDHALGDVKGVMVGYRDDARAQFDTICDLSCRRKKHFRRGNRFPAGGMVLAHPEFVVMELVEEPGEFQVALELERWMLTNGMMRREKSTEAEPTVHLGDPP